MAKSERKFQKITKKKT